MDIYLIRHTSVAAAPGTCYGISDIDVAETFSEEVALLQKKLSGILPHRVYSSPLKRCTNLASVLSNDYKIDDRLREINFGNWEMKKWDEIDPGQYDRWMNDFVNIPCPKGEKYLDIYHNAVSFFNEITTLANESIFVVTHAGIIRSLVSYVLEYPLEHSFRFEFDTGSVTQIVSGHKFFKVRCLNR